MKTVMKTGKQNTGTYFAKVAFNKHKIALVDGFVELRLFSLETLVSDINRRRVRLNLNFTHGSKNYAAFVYSVCVGTILGIIRDDALLVCADGAQ